MIAVILFVGFHLIGMQLLLRIGLFPWVCATAWLVFIPRFFWDVVECFFTKECKPLTARKSSPRKRAEARSSARVF